MADRGEVEDEVASATKSLAGPPPPRGVTIFCRVLEITTFILVAVWVFASLGGLRFTPKRLSDDTNSTDGIFNWHPLLMALAWPVLMAEAVLSYRVPIKPDLARPYRKKLHAALQTFSLVLIVFALVAVFQSHNLKRPTPIPNLYSPHSWLGIFTVSLAGLQYLLAFYSFLWPGANQNLRKALVPVHAFLGRTVFTLGLATMAVGIQEKTTFLIDGKKVSGVYASGVRIPAALELLLASVGVLVLYHHMAQPDARRQRFSDDPDPLLA